MKIAVGLSGGVDSAVCAKLLKDAGHDVTGVYLQCWDKKDDGCTFEEDKSYAIRNAAHLGISFVHLNFVEQYDKKVIDYFYSEYSSGRTPNPDILCNLEIKFGLFLDWAKSNGFDKIATGHYACVSYDQSLEEFQLFRGIDSTKDQSYFLHQLTQDMLSYTLFPLGSYIKSDIRKIALENNLPSCDRPDSMGICFIGKVAIKEFLQKRLSVKTGVVLDRSGNKIGTHEGAWFYTIGQRHGFAATANRITPDTDASPLYIISKDTKKNEIVVGPRNLLDADTFNVSDIHWINLDTQVAKLLKCGVRVRNLGEIYPCELEVSKGVVRIISSKIFGVAPGQFAVFYDGSRCLGGGIIN